MDATLIDILRALADPTRLRIMRLLTRMELAVGELAQVLDQSQPRVSRHIRILAEAGLAERRREGSWVFVRSISGVDRPPLAAAVAGLIDRGEAGDPAFAAQAEADRLRLGQIRHAREARAADYFARHAAQWDVLRSLHSAEATVEAELARLLGGVSQNALGLGRVLDVGTGTGRMAELFEPAADAVIALDNSPEMLRLARARLQHLAPGRVELVQGDFAALPFADASFDTVLFHQVLHYAQSPEAVLAEAARVTRSGGRVAIVDFAPHDREELRSAHAHVRLGFSSEQVAALLDAAGFAPEASEALGGGELTVMIWTGLRRADAVSRLPRRKESA
ncbi:metalloregulator ArsR/SmtB family transcription factor [Novosphingobium sp. Gsoil 351]|nr:metalloregulator ArsR/SmtB family transcription factor [Novosphingobium sp. Gsoil 351]